MFYIGLSSVLEFNSYEFNLVFCLVFFLIFSLLLKNENGSAKPNGKEGKVSILHALCVAENEWNSIPFEYSHEAILAFSEPNWPVVESVTSDL